MYRFVFLITLTSGTLLGGCMGQLTEPPQPEEDVHAPISDPQSDPVPFGPEECGDGQDNNDNGRVDETCSCAHLATQNCYSGPAATRGVGTCHDGTQQCAAGEEFSSWGECADEVLPADETCDGMDNNCDGTVDETCAGGGGTTGGPDPNSTDDKAPRCKANPAATMVFGARNPFRVLEWAQRLASEVGLSSPIDPYVAGAVSAYDPMPNKLCQLAGFERATSSSCDSSYGDGCGFDSCHDNVMVIWDSAADDFKIINACTAGNRWISDIVCGC